MGVEIEFEQVLEELGVGPRSLSAEERRALDEQGYVLLEDAADPDWLPSARAAFDAALDRERSAPIPGARRETGTRHVALPDPEDDTLDRTFVDPRLVAALWHVLRRPFRVLHVNGREPLQGYGLQGLHTDWRPRTGPTYSAATALWLLDGFEAENGATRVVPGSHRIPRPLPKSMQAPEGRAPGQRVVCAPAGSVLVFNGHLWHGGTRNESGRRRRVVQVACAAADEAPPREAGGATPPARLSRAARWLFG